MYDQLIAASCPILQAASGNFLALKKFDWFGDSGRAPEEPSSFDVAFDETAGVMLRRKATPVERKHVTSGLGTLIARVQRRDEAALKELHDACAEKLLAVATRIVRRPELAGEAVSATFFHVWSRAADFDGGRSNVLTWLCMIVRSRALDVLRQSRTRGQYECALTEADLESISGACPPPCSQVEQVQRCVGLRRAMATLTPMQRQVVSLLFLEGRSHEEAAAHIGLPLGTLKSHSRRALAALRDHAGLRAVHEGSTRRMAAG